MVKIVSLKTGFGWIEVNNKRYDYDIILDHTGNVVKRDKSISEPFTSEYGHTPLSEKELQLYIKDRDFEVIYVGTGQSGVLPLTSEAKQMLNNYTTIIKPTPEILNDILKEKRRFVAILHTTC